MKLRHVFFVGVGILALFSVGVSIYLRALYATGVVQISRPERKLKVFVNYAFAVVENLNEREFRLHNLEFFLRHGVTFSETANITYGITVSGDFLAALVAQRHSERARQLGLPPIFILRRENEGYDFGAHAAMLDAQCKHMGMTPNCILPYEAFIFFNDGVRGPFLPSYMPEYYHWSQAFLDKLTALQHPSIIGFSKTEDHLSRKVALVGTSIACLSKTDEAVIRDPSFFGPKVEGFAFAVTGEALAYVRKETTVFSSHDDKVAAVISGEYNLTRTVLLAPRRWGVTSLLKQHEGIDFRDQRAWDCNSNIHPSREGSYGPGSEIAPLEVIFHKARWHNGDRVSEKMMAIYSDWEDQVGESYEFSTENGCTLVSYVHGGNAIDAKVETPLCDNNLDVFLKRGYFPYVDVDFVFIVLRGGQVPKKLQDLARVSTNVFIHEATVGCGFDLCQHQSVIDKKKRMKHYSEFVFLSCDARGPYSLGPGQPTWYTWYRNVRNVLKTYDAIGPTISSEIGYHLQTYMIAVSNRSIHIIDALWHKRNLSKESALMQLVNLNISMKHLLAVGHFLKLQPSDTKLRIALGELGLSFVLFSNGKKLHATCFDARTVGVAPVEGEGTNPTCCFKSNVAAECLNATLTHLSSADCVACPPLQPYHCMFVKFGGDVVRNNLLSPWTYARVSEYDLRDLGAAPSI